MLNRKIMLSLACAVVMSLAKSGDAGHKRQAPVPPGLEIEILDPGVDPVGNPAVLTAPNADGQLRIDIPQTVLVHKYYYTGDRCFQGPLLPGGPAIVVVNHPKSGERCYIEMQMLPGAPRVIYTSHSIEYDYGKQGITLSFGMCGKPKVCYRNHKPAVRKVGAAMAGVAKAAHHVSDTTGLSCLGSKLAQGTKGLAAGAAGGVKTAGTIVLTPLAQAAQVIPGVKTLSSSSVEQRAAAARDDAVGRAQQKTSLSDASIPTVR